MTDLFSKIKEVTEIPAISGHEAPVRDYLRPQLTPHVDEIVDRWSRWDLWSQTFNSCRCSSYLSSCSHGWSWFYDQRTKADGTFRVVPIGGWNPMLSAANASKLFTRDGREYPRYFRICSSSFDNVEQVDQPYLSLATSSLMQALVLKLKLRSYGIRPGDTLVPDSSAILTANGKNVISKAWDNRYTASWWSAN